MPRNGPADRCTLWSRYQNIISSMQKKILTAALLVAMAGPGLAQEYIKGAPYGLLVQLGTEDVPVLRSPGLDMEAVMAEDATRDAAGALPMYGRVVPVHADLLTTGLWTVLPNGDRLWRLQVESPGALAVEVFFEDLRVPTGGLLHVYSADGAQVLGGYDQRHAGTDGVFSSEQVLGEACVVEFLEPAAAIGEGSLRITGVGHAYRGVGAAKAQDCQVDVVCVPEGNGWQEESDGVVRLRVKEGSQLGWCSGSLVNNTASDCRPFILTALHCGVNSSTADFQQWKFYFKYQRTGCDQGFASASKVMTGCIRRADSNDGGGNTGSDFLLVETEDPVPPSYGPYWNGWDATGTGGSSGVSIHHPAGDEKKISTYTSNLISSSWGASQTHWRVIWSGTTNGHGVTEGGSSGSPIFNSAGRIVGTLTGGGSYCNSVVPGGQNQPDYYGKMDRHWNSNPNPANEKLRVWLDPGNTGQTTFDGSYDPCGNVGIGERAQEEGLLVFPNPADDRLVVEYPDGLTRVDRIELLDASGRVVRSEVPLSTGRTTIPVSDLTSGFYLVRVIAGETVHPAARVSVMHR